MKISATWMTTLLYAMSLMANQPLKKEERKKVKKQAEELASDYTDLAWSNLRNLFQGKSQQLLSQISDKKPLDPDKAKEACKTQHFSAFSKEIEKVLLAGREPPAADIDPLLQTSRTSIKDPQTILGIKSYPPNSSLTRQLESCLEKETDLRKVVQNRIVTLRRKVTGREFICKGHNKFVGKYIFRPSKEGREIKKTLASNSNISWYKVYIEKPETFSLWSLSYEFKHKSPTGCNNYVYQDITEEVETERWETEGGKDLLTKIEADPKCSLFDVQESNGETRLIGTKRISRPSWKKTILFSCQHDPSSKCARLRKQGGLLVSKKCFKTSDDRCVLWEKTYDMGGGLVQENSLITFNNDALFDLENTDTSYPANRELGEAIATLAAIADVSRKADVNFDPHRAAIFSGKKAKCRRSFDSDNLFDCCYSRREEGRGLCITARLGKCNEEERDLYADDRDGKCHYIGNIEEFFMTRQVHCCFPTKLSRIIHEEGRKQLGIGWGTPKKPACQGFSLDQIGNLDFSEMDLSEYIRDIRAKIDEKELTKKLTQAAENFTKTTSLSDLKQKTDSCLQSQYEIIKGGSDVSQ